MNGLRQYCENTRAAIARLYADAVAEEWVESVCEPRLERLRRAIANAADITAGCLWRERQGEEELQALWPGGAPVGASLNSTVDAHRADGRIGITLES